VRHVKGTVLSVNVAWQQKARVGTPQTVQQAVSRRLAMAEPRRHIDSFKSILSPPATISPKIVYVTALDPPLYRSHLYSVSENRFLTS
jgi:hypothetical protein